MAGRPPKPLVLHRRDGTFQPVRHAERERLEPTPRAVPAKMPAWAHLDGEARAMWRRLAPVLTEMRVLTEADVVALVQICRRYSRWVVLDAVVDEEGATFEEHRYDKDGNLTVSTVKPRPEVAMADRAWNDFLRGLGLFGLDPSSRSRVHAAPPKEAADPFAELMGGKRGTG